MAICAASLLATTGPRRGATGSRSARLARSAPCVRGDGGPLLLGAERVEGRLVLGDLRLQGGLLRRRRRRTGACASAAACSAVACAWAAATLATAACSRISLWWPAMDCRVATRPTNSSAESLVMSARKEPMPSPV